MRSEEITDIFTKAGIKKLKVKQILVFDNKGAKTELKITKIEDGRVWAHKCKTYEVNELTVTEKGGGRKKRQTINEYLLGDNK